MRKQTMKNGRTGGARRLASHTLAWTLLACTYITIDGVLKMWCCDAAGNCMLM